MYCFFVRLYRLRQPVLTLKQDSSEIEKRNHGRKVQIPMLLKIHYIHLQIVMCIGHVGAKCQGSFEDQFGVRQFALLSENVAKVSQSYIVKRRRIDGHYLTTRLASCFIMQNTVST